MVNHFEMGVKNYQIRLKLNKKLREAYMLYLR